MDIPTVLQQRTPGGVAEAKAALEAYNPDGQPLKESVGPSPWRWDIPVPGTPIVAQGQDDAEIERMKAENQARAAATPRAEADLNTQRLKVLGLSGRRRCNVNTQLPKVEASGDRPPLCSQRRTILAAVKAHPRMMSPVLLEYLLRGERVGRMAEKGLLTSDFHGALKGVPGAEIAVLIADLQFDRKLVQRISGFYPALELTAEGEGYVASV